VQLKGRAEVDRWTLGRLDGEAALPARRIEDGADVSCWVLVDLHASFGTQGLVEAFVEARCVERLLIRRKESSRLCQSQQASDHDGQQIHTHMLPDERWTVRVRADLQNRDILLFRSGQVYGCVRRGG